MSKQDDIASWRVVIAMFILRMRESDLVNLARDPYMNVHQVARYLGCHPETVRRLTREVPRVLHAVNVGGLWRYKKSQVDADVAAWTERRRAYYTRARWEKNEQKRDRERRRRQGLLGEDEDV